MGEVTVEGVTFDPDNVHVLDALRIVARRNKARKLTSVPPVGPSGDGDAIEVRRGSEAAYAASAVEDACARLAAESEGGRNASLNGTAYALGRLVDPLGLDVGDLRVRLEAACSAAGNGLTVDDGITATRATIESGLRGGMAKPRALRLVDAATSPDEDPFGTALQSVAPDTPTRRTSWSAVELMTTDFPEPRWAVDGYLCEGLNLLVGAPKVGKSWLALNIATAVGGGGKALGAVDVEVGHVLYLALEDTPRRLGKRLNMIVDRTAMPTELDCHNEWPDLSNRGAEQLDTYLAAHPGTRLVIVDVLAKMRGPINGKENAYAADYAAMATLKRVADKYAVAVLVLHHDRKTGSDDFVSTVSGTHGIAGSADAILMLKRSRNSNEATLHITGRDVEERAAALAFDTTNGRWHLLDKPVGDVGMSIERQAMLGMLRTAPGLGPTECARRLGMKTDAAKKMLARLLEAGLVANDGRGHYSVVETDTPQSPLPVVTTVPPVTVEGTPVTGDSGTTAPEQEGQPWPTN